MTGEFGTSETLGFEKRKSGRFQNSGNKCDQRSCLMMTHKRHEDGYVDCVASDETLGVMMRGLLNPR